MTECPFCAGKGLRQLFVSPLGSVHSCDDCHGIANQPDIDTNDYYDLDYYRENYLQVRASQIVRFTNYFERISALKTAVGPVLDYGCGTGAFLEAAEAAGHQDNVGIDVSRAAVELAASLNSATGSRFQLPDQPLQGRFAMLTLIDSVAHVPEIGKLLQRLVEEHLDQQGLVFIRTPRYNRVYFVYARLLAKLLPAHIAGSLYFLPQRYLLFTETSLRCFLQRAGLELCQLERERAYRPLVWQGGMKQWLKTVLLQLIPRWLNPCGSMLVVARRSERPLPAAGEER